MILLDDERVMERLIGRDDDRTEIGRVEPYKKSGEGFPHGFWRWSLPRHVEGGAVSSPSAKFWREKVVAAESWADNQDFLNWAINALGWIKVRRPRFYKREDEMGLKGGFFDMSAIQSC